MSKARDTVVSNCEKKFVLKNLSEWNRLDARAFDEFRELSIDFGKDWGCCYVSLGKTRVIAQVSCEIQVPKSSRPSEGLLNIYLELNPIGAPHFEPGKNSDLSIQLNRLLEKCIKDSKAIDLESLCIKTKEKVWALRVDVNVLNHEGNILDCASVAAITALAHFRRPDVTSDGEDIIVHSYAQRDPIPTVIHHYPVCTTYAIFNNGDVIVADPTLLEEGVADAHITIALNAYKELCSLHLGGSALMTPNLILQTTNKAASRAGLVIKQIKKLIDQDTEIRLKREPIGFQLSLIELEKEIKSPELEKYLDQWNVKKSKKNKKKQKLEGGNMEVDGESNKHSSGDVQFLGRGSAVLVPVDNEKQTSVWAPSSEEESEEETEIKIPESTPTEQKQNTREISDESEEEKVIVINKQSAKKKKQKK